MRKNQGRSWVKQIGGAMVNLGPPKYVWSVFHVFMWQVWSRRSRDPKAPKARSPIIFFKCDVQWCHFGAFGTLTSQYKFISLTPLRMACWCQYTWHFCLQTAKKRLTVSDIKFYWLLSFPNVPKFHHFTFSNIYVEDPEVLLLDSWAV